jgi:hypothetical protein
MSYRFSSDIQALRNMQQQFLEALRHREQEVFRYLVIIGPALGGFVWMLSKYDAKPPEIDVRTLCIGSLGLVLLLLLGTWYCASLGYNYRYLTFQLMKIERELNLAHTLLGWPRRPRDMMDRSKLGHYLKLFLRNKRSGLYRFPWCFPPGLIGVFWWAFVIGIVFLTTAAACTVRESCCWVGTTIGVGIGCLVVALLGPILHGRKFRRFCLEASGHHPRNGLLGFRRGGPMGRAKVRTPPVSLPRPGST